jgi:hypothetical protein
VSLFLQHGFVDPHVVEKMWREQFDFYYREYDTFVFPISIHPQVSGKVRQDFRVREETQALLKSLLLSGPSYLDA